MSDFEKMFTHPVIERLRAAEHQKYDGNYFAEHYWREDLPGLTGNRGLSYDDPDHRQRFVFLYDKVIKPLNPKTLLDVGCGTGLLIDQALRDGVDAYGIDSSSIAQQSYHTRTQGRWPDRFRLGSITTLPFQSSQFELCVCLDVLEHIIVFDIFHAVTELCRVCSKDIVCSINMDNPYQFHPTILSRSSWVALFESTGVVTYQRDRTAKLSSLISPIYQEYEVFVFSKLGTK